MLASLLPLGAALIAAIAGAIGAVGLTAEARLVRRANRLLDLAERLPARGVRRDLRAAASADAARALQMRASGKALGSGIVTAVVVTIVAFGIPAYVQRYPEQGTGFQGYVWVVSWALYSLGAVAAWTVVLGLVWRRSKG